MTDTTTPRRWQDQLPTPVREVDDLERIATLPDFPEHPDETTVRDPLGTIDGSGRDDRRVAQHRAAYRRWLYQARKLAAAGVHIEASHDDDGHVSFSGAFVDAPVLARRLDPERHGTGDRPFDEDAIVVLYGRDVNPTELDDLHVPTTFDLWAVWTQSAGIACHQRHLIGIPLKLTDAGRDLARRVSSFADRNGHECVGAWTLTLSELADYRDHLRGLGLSAEGVWERLEEAVYPVDREHVAAFTDDPVPSDELLDGQPDDTWPHFPTEASRWAVYILGPNCD